MEIKPAVSLPKTIIESPSLGLQLAQEGENDSPYFSPDGKQVLFISQKRRVHTQAQVYLVDVESLAERRVTFQDGQCSDPIFSLDGKKIIYASNTDERKERLSLVKEASESEVWPAAEIYEQNVDGTEIERLTNKEGFDGAPSAGAGPFIYYERWNGENVEIWKLNAASKATSPLLSSADKSIEDFQFSQSEQKTAWIERDKDDKTQIMVSKKAIKLPPGEYKNLTWWDHKLVFATNALDKRFQIYAYNTKTECMELLLSHTSDLSQPHMHPTRDALVYVSNASGKNQVYYKSINVSATPTCVNKSTSQSSP